MKRKLLYGLFALMCIAIGLYPLKYILADSVDGLLRSKPEWLLAQNLWNTAFYGHISFGGLALLTGWPQFVDAWRQKNIKLHRALGRLYVIFVFCSGLCAVYLSFYATGGLISGTGFFLLGILWLSTTFMAYKSVKGMDFERHKYWMVLSYALCVAAVTLRIELPLLMIFFDFIIAYKIVAWLCWVPNLGFGLYLNRKMNKA